MHIAIAGNIGSGKTTLTRMLAKHYGWEARFEPVENNPYLSDYYDDMSRWGFNMEVFFLRQRLKDLISISQVKNTIVQDRSIWEGVYVFTRANWEMGNLSDRDYATYMELFQQVEMMVERPRLMIYLKASVPCLVKNIQKRNRECEQKMPIDYLKQLNKNYDEFINHCYEGDVLHVNVDEMDFEHNESDFGKIIEQIDARLFGLFN